MRYFVGLDLGQASEPTALAVLERPWVHPGELPSRRRPTYALRHLRRFPPATPYPEVFEAVRDLLRAPPLPGSVLAVDQTGVGKAVVDLLRDGLQGRVTCSLCAVTLTAGHGVTAGEQAGLYVPKKELAGALQVLLQTRRLRIARALPDAALLLKELETFTLKVTVAHKESVEAWREGPQDDLVLAAGLAAWMGELALPPLENPKEEGRDTRLWVP